jgi:hypothetical protein
MARTGMATLSGVVVGVKRSFGPDKNHDKVSRSTPLHTSCKSLCSGNLGGLDLTGKAAVLKVSARPQPNATQRNSTHPNAPSVVGPTPPNAHQKHRQTTDKSANGGNL